MSSWLKYNLSQNTYNPVSVNEVVTINYDKIHQILFTKAMHLALVDYAQKSNNNLEIIEEKFNDEFYDDVIKCFKYKNKWIYCESYDGLDSSYTLGYIDLSNWRIYENTNNAKNYFDPTSIICISKSLINKKGQLQYEKIVIDLTPYWDNKYLKEIGIKEHLEIIDEKYPFNEIIEYNYINAKAKIENRIEGTKNWINFSEISENDTLKIENF